LGDLHLYRHGVWRATCRRVTRRSLAAPGRERKGTWQHQRVRTKPKAFILTNLETEHG
jgi:hypothetical protein